MADFNPSNSLVRNGWEAVNNIPPAEAALDGFFRLGPGGELMTPTFAGVEANEIDGTVFSSGPIQTLFQTGPKAINMRLRGDKATLRFISHMMRNSSAVGTPPTATLARTHFQNQLQTVITYPSSLTVQVARDNGRVYTHHNCRVQELVWTIAGGELVNLQASLVWGNFSHFDQTVEVVPGATPNTADPVLIGLLSKANLDLPDNDVDIQVATITNLPTSVTMFAKMGAASYGTDEFTVTIGNDSAGRPILNRVLDSNGGAPLGTTCAPVIIYASDGTGFEVLDEWSWIQLPEWTQALGTQPLLNTCAAIIQIDGVDRRLNNLTITQTRDIQLPGGGTWVGSSFAFDLFEAGDLITAVAIARDQGDFDFDDQKLFNSTSRLTVEMKSDELIDAGTALDHRILLTMPKLIPAAGAEWKTTTEQTAREETIDLMALEDPTDPTYKAPLTVEIRTDIADLTI